MVEQLPFKQRVAGSIPARLTTSLNASGLFECPGPVQLGCKSHKELPMRTGILGYSQSGKSTLFSVLAGPSASSAAGGINVGTVQVPDLRLEQLRDLFKPKKYTPAKIEYVDLAAQGGEKSGALLPQQITTADMILLVVRAFEDPAVHHPQGSVDPKRDLAGLLDELILKDMTVVEARLEKLKKSKNVGVKEAVDEQPLLERCLEALESGTPIRDLDFRPEEEKALRGYQFLTAKACLVVFNVGDSAAAGAGLAEAVEAKPGFSAVEICGKAEVEIAELDGSDQKEFMELMGIAESGLARVIRSSYELLGLCSFFTVGEDEVRAWTIRNGTPAVEAAGVIHSDLQRGFIRAEVVPSRVLLELGGLSQVKQANKMSVEGKEYTVQDGDVLNIRFSV